MRFLIQRVKKAKVDVEKKCVGNIGNGLLVFVGVGKEDSQKEADDLVRKLIGLRIFEDEQNKMNLSIREVKGEMLVISQFTLYADCNQ